jgi:hypothetical protein
VHEGGRADVAVGAGERAAVEVAGATGEGERPVDHADCRFADERLRGLRLGEQVGQLVCGWRRGRVALVLLVDQAGGA